jgi:hypothetical protein
MNATEIALHSGRQLAQRDHYMSSDEIHSEAMMLAHHKGIADEDVDRFVRLFTCAYCFHCPMRFTPTLVGPCMRPHE